MLTARVYMEKLAMFGGAMNGRKVIENFMTHAKENRLKPPALIRAENPLGSSLQDLSWAAEDVVSTRKAGRRAMAAGNVPDALDYAAILKRQQKALAGQHKNFVAARDAAGQQLAGLLPKR